MHAFTNAAFQWPMLLSTCALVMSNACTPCLMFPVIGRRRLLIVYKSWLMIRAIGRSRYGTADEHTTHVMYP